MHGRSRRSVLSTGWKLEVDPTNIGREEGWFQHGTPDSAREVPVPGIIQQVYPAYHGVAWYWLPFQPEVIPDIRERALLHFGAVDYYADVWLNGVYVGQHEGGETPFDCDVTATLAPNVPNMLVVRVINPTAEPIDGLVLSEVPQTFKSLPYRVGAAFNHGGIVLPVELRIAPIVRIVGLFQQSDWQTGTIAIDVALENGGSQAVAGTLTTTLLVPSSDLLTPDLIITTPIDIGTGTTTQTVTLQVSHPRLWSMDDPFLYQVSVHLATTVDGVTDEHAAGVRCGFRDFRVGDDGFFYLNGRRIFLRSSHTCNHYPIGQRVAHNPDILKRDLLLAKTAGYNMIRFIAGMAYPEQLDYCDEIGLMVYEEPYAAWLLGDSPRMQEYYDSSIVNMIRRDRNHPSVVVWGLLNETYDNPISRHAKTILPLVRSEDTSRLVLLGSGRWDGEQSVGSVANPNQTEWQQVWGLEAAGAPMTAATSVPGYWEGAGDAHVYPRVPHTAETINFLRTLGSTTKPVFLSEYGIGSLVDAIRTTRLFEQAGASPDLEDAALYRSMAQQFEADWQRYGMDGVYPFPEDMLRESQRLHAQHRTVGLNAIRSNPNLCGYNLTGTVDQVMAGEGCWTTWRELKPGAIDALIDGFAPLRWCLFVTPLNVYKGRPFRIEVVLANEDVLSPGTYPVCARVTGPGGIAWQRRLDVVVPACNGETLGALAIPVIDEEIVVDGLAGSYCFAVNMEQGGAPAGGRLNFHVSDPADLPRRHTQITTLGIAGHVQTWLEDHGVTCHPFNNRTPDTTDLIVVGALDDTERTAATWNELTERISQGATAIFLEPSAFVRDDDPVGWLPLVNRGACRKFNNWLYHREDVARPHPIFAGLPSPGILDWYTYEQIIPLYLFHDLDTPDDVAAAGFAVGYTTPGGYTSGLVTGTYRLGAGAFVVNTLRILENLDSNPAADRLLLNMIDYASTIVSTHPARS